MADEYRPQSFDEYVGQEKLKRRLKLHIEAAKRTGRPLEHVFLSAAPGYGKTSLASLIAQEMGVEMACLTMPVDEFRLMELLISLEFSGVLLIDELHRGSKKNQETLLPLIEFSTVYCWSEPLQVKGPITVVGATTELDKVIDPLVDRFGIKPDFDNYTDEEMSEIVAGMCRKAGVELENHEYEVLGRAAGGTPRNARQLVVAARDIATVEGEVSADDVLEFCRVSSDGLSENHQRYLGILRKQKGKAGLRPLAEALQMPDEAVRDLERLLVDRGYVAHTPQGRVLLGAGFERSSHL